MKSYVYYGVTTAMLLLWSSGFTLSLNPQRIVIVGGGVGGLATAARIAAQMSPESTSTTNPKPEITIVEKNPTVGGRCGSYDVDVPGYGTFRHEQGPSLLLLPHIYERLFRDCAGSSAQDYGLDMVPCSPAYQIVFDDGERLCAGYRRRRRRGEGDSPFDEGELESRAVMDSLEEDGSRKWDEYMRACQAFLDCGLPNFIEEKLNLLSFPSFLVESLRDWGKAWPLKPPSDVLDSFFTSPKMKALASFQDLYVGLEPYRNNDLIAGGVFGTTAPAVFGLLAAIELHPDNPQCGVFAPRGGFRTVSSALEKLCTDLGVQIQCNQTVTSISDSGVFVQAADTDTNDNDNHSSLFLPADLVIVNADLPYVQNSLVQSDKDDNNNSNNHDAENNPTTATERYDWSDQNYRFSSGVISFHWSTNRTLDFLNTHNVFLQAGSDREAMQSWSCLRQQPQNPWPYRFPPDGAYNFYVHRPTKTDPTAAPKGCDSITILFPCPTLTRQESLSNERKSIAIKGYDAQLNAQSIDEARQVIFQRFMAVGEDLTQCIVHESVDTPVTMANAWNVAAGTPFGLNHALSQLSRLRPTSLENNTHKTSSLLCVGASCRPGNGVPLVLVGAEQTADRAVKYLFSKKTQ